MKKRKREKEKEKEKNVTRLSEASRADNKQNSSLWVPLEMWEAFKTFLKLSGKEKKKSLLKGCSNLFYCGLFISGEKAITRRSPTSHQPCQGLPGFGGRTLVWGACWERVGPPLAKRGKGCWLWCIPLEQAASAQHRALTQGSSDTQQILFEWTMIEPTNKQNKWSLKLLPHFGWPGCALYLLTP